MAGHSLAESRILLPFNTNNNPGPYYEMNNRFRREDERLKTFEKWPLEWLDKHELAMTGMFFTGIDDKTRCYFCDIIIGQWEYEDNPVQEHLRWSSNCALLKRRKTNNIPINAERLENILPKFGHDVIPGLSQSLGSPKVMELEKVSEKLSQSETKSDNKKLCKICFTNEYNAAFLSCGHVVSCVNCASAVRCCPICRSPSAGIVRLYFS